MIENMFQLPSLQNVEEVVVNKDVVEKNYDPLIIYSDNAKKLKSSASWVILKSLENNKLSTIYYNKIVKIIKVK